MFCNPEALCALSSFRSDLSSDLLKFWMGGQSGPTMDSGDFVDESDYATPSRTSIASTNTIQVFRCFIISDKNFCVEVYVKDI